MTSSMKTHADLPAIRACTISRDVRNFDLLIEDMETAMSDAWGDLGFVEALAFLAQPEAKALEFVALVMDAGDEDDLPLLSEIVATARQRGIRSILIAEDASPAALHQLLRSGADEFVPYPLPEGELQAAIERLQGAPLPRPGPEASAAPPQGARLPQSGAGVVIAVQGLAGGTGGHRPLAHQPLPGNWPPPTKRPRRRSACWTSACNSARSPRSSTCRGATWCSISGPRPSVVDGVCAASGPRDISGPLARPDRADRHPAPRFYRAR